MNPQMIEVAAGAILPPLIDILNKRIANTRLRYIISLVICLIIGTLLSLNNLSIEEVLGSGAIIFAASQTVYKTYWQDSTVRSKLLAQ